MQKRNIVRRWEGNIKRHFGANRNPWQAAVNML